MELNQTHKSDIEEDQVLVWLNHLSIPSVYYQEPKLQESSIEIVKAICDVLEQSNEVFITSVDVLEKYVHTKPHDSNYNSLIVSACGILMSSKLVGSDPDIKIATLQKIIYKLSNEEVDRNTIKATELEMLLTVGNIPLNTIVTDLTMFLNYYIKNMKLKVDVTPLCLEILDLVYISRKRLFYHIKSLYNQNSDAVNVFKHLVCNKFYFLGGIVLCALKLTKLRHCIHIQQVAEDIGQISGIHFDHLYVICDGIHELVTAVQAQTKIVV